MAPTKLLLMAQPLKHPKSESVPDATRKKSTRPDPYPRVRVGSGIPAGTGRPAHLICNLHSSAKQNT